ncbi:hypothetical protein, partial [Novilysobacter defluvii]|uniref:hypothetical protein n=1 Tax=Novilysobacter defluvii TaxID=391738 RepID=UPI001E2AE772
MQALIWIRGRPLVHLRRHALMLRRQRGDGNGDGCIAVSFVRAEDTSGLRLRAGHERSTEVGKQATDPVCGMNV